MTPELYQKFQKAVSEGDVCVKPYVGVDFILDETENVYFVHVIVNRASREVYTHYLKREDPYSAKWDQIWNDDPLAIMAIDKANRL